MATTISWLQKILHQTFSFFECVLYRQNINGHVCALMVGRMGNNMFQYAATYGITRQRNMTMIIDEMSDIKSVFPNLLALKDNAGLCINYTEIKERVNSAYSIDIERMCHKKDYRLSTWLQSWKYFDNVKDDIRKQFTFTPQIQNDASQIFNTLLQRHNVQNYPNVTFVGVHVRRGDIVEVDSKVKYGFQIPDKQYFFKAFEMMRRAFKDVFFIVASDDRKWVRTNLLQNDVTMTEEQQPPEVDMATLTLCNHTIMSVGTFGWWVAFLTGGSTIYYKHPTREGSEARTTFSNDMLDFYYPEWIGLD